MPEFNDVSPATGALVITRADIEAEFGATMVANWADVENNGVEAEITTTIQHHIDAAEAWLIGKLSFKFTGIETCTDEVLRDIAVKEAAWRLYSIRGVKDGSPDNNELKVHKKYVNDTLKSILAGTIKISCTRKLGTAVGIAGDTDVTARQKTNNQTCYRICEG